MSKITKKTKAPQEPIKKTNLKKKGYYGLFLFFFTFLLYSNSIFNDYNLDDELVTRHHLLTSQGIKAIPKIFSTPYYSSEGTAYEYRPVVLTSFAIENQVFGENPQTSHFINVLLYALSILVLFITLKKIFHAYNILLPFIVTLLFAAHPLHTEVVASIKNRDEILALLFALLSTLTAFDFVQKTNLRSLFFCFTTFILAILSKSSIIPFAFIIPMGLFFFTKATDKQVLLVSLGLSIASGFFAPFYNFSFKVFFTLAVFISPFILNILLNRRQIFVAYWRIIKSHIKANAESPESILKLSVAEIWIIILISIFLSSVGIFYNLRILFFIAILGLIILYYASNRISKEYFFCTLIFIVSLISINYKQAHILTFCLVLILFMYFFAEKKLKTYLIFSLLFLFVPWVIWAKLEGVFWIVYIGFIMWGFSVKKFRIFAIVLIIVFFICSPIVSFMRHLNIFQSIYMYSFVALSLTFLIYYKFKNYKPAVLFLLVLIPIALSIKLSTMTGSYSIIVEKYFNPATSINIGTNILPASGRKLDIVEMPLGINDPMSLKVGTGLFVMAEYLKLLVFPIKMGYYYGYKYIEPHNWSNGQSLISFIIHALMLIFSVYYYKKEKVFLFATLVYLASISLFSDIVAPLPGLMADRFTYAASLGFVMLIGIIMIKLFKVNEQSHAIVIKNHKNLFLLLGVIMLLYSVRTFSRNEDWKDHLTLFRHDIEHLKNSAQAQNLLATNLIIYSNNDKNLKEAMAMKEEAVGHYRKALEIYPAFFNACYDISRTFVHLEMKDSALVYYKRTMTLRPEFYDPYLQTAYIYHQRDSFNLAILYYYKTLDIKANIPNVYKNLTSIYFAQKKFDNVIVTNRQYKDFAPEVKEPLINIAQAYFLSQRYDSAAFYFKEILKVDPSDVNAIKALMDTYNRTNNKTEFEYYNKLLQTKTP